MGGGTSKGEEVPVLEIGGKKVPVTQELADDLVKQSQNLLKQNQNLSAQIKNKKTFKFPKVETKYIFIVVLVVVAIILIVNGVKNPKIQDPSRTRSEGGRSSLTPATIIFVVVVVSVLIFFAAYAYRLYG